MSGVVEFDPSDFGAIPTPRVLRRWMRDTRRKHADRSFWQMFEDAYLVIFTLAMVGACGGNVVEHLNSNAARCTSFTCHHLSTWMPWIAVPLLLAITIRVLLSVGPVSASRATGFWLLATPVNRATLLRPTYRLVVAVVAVAGFLATLVIWALIGSTWIEMLGAALLLAALLVCSAVATVWAQQSSRRSRWTLRVADLLLIAAVVPAVLLAFQRRSDTSSFRNFIVTGQTVESIPFNMYSERVVTTSQVQLLLACLVVIVLCVVLTVIASHTLDKLSRTSVIAGGELLAGLAGAASSLDLSMLADVVAGRHWRLKGRAHTRRGRGSGGAAIVQREFVRILRWPRRLIIGFALLVVPYAVAGAGFDVLVPVAAGFAGFVAVRPLMDGLRSVCRSKGLVRALGWELRELRVVMAVVPGLVAILWAALASPAIGSLEATFAVAAGMISGAVRQASARPPSYSGPLVASPMGAIPPGMFSQPARGFDLLLICLAPVLLGLSSTWVLVIPAAVLIIMFAVGPKTD
ncbi:DUF6297 family protein [Kribbella sp. NPDC026611]|uniref:DUF6297 family protein n=1 Tax=Kribbella sp. NPDC026611 TaxID=3154911 RepID=UPI0033C7147E